jgi:hypothetical protein
MSRRLLIGTVVLVVFAIVGVAWATIPSKDGTINACSMNKTGIVRIIDASSEKCMKIETPISWNQAGSRGPGIARSRSAPGSRRSYSIIALARCSRATTTTCSRTLAPADLLLRAATPRSCGSRWIVSGSRRRSDRHTISGTPRSRTRRRQARLRRR